MEDKCSNCGYEKKRSGCLVAIGVLMAILGMILLFSSMADLAS